MPRTPTRGATYAPTMQFISSSSSFIRDQRLRQTAANAMWDRLNAHFASRVCQQESIWYCYIDTDWHLVQEPLCQIVPLLWQAPAHSRSRCVDLHGLIHAARHGVAVLGCACVCVSARAYCGCTHVPSHVFAMVHIRIQVFMHTRMFAHGMIQHCQIKKIHMFLQKSLQQILDTRCRQLQEAVRPQTQPEHPCTNHVMTRRPVTHIHNIPA
jgi:hypothetical protein